VLYLPDEAAPSDFRGWPLFRPASRQFLPPTLCPTRLLPPATWPSVTASHYAAERPRSLQLRTRAPSRSSSLVASLPQPLSCPRPQPTLPARTKPSRLSFEFSKDAVRICRMPHQSRVEPLPAECQHPSRFQSAPNR